MRAQSEHTLPLSELQERNKFLETLLNLSPNILYIYDLVEMKNVYSNEGVQKILGYSTQEIKDFGSKLISSLMHPEDLQTYLGTTLAKYASAKDNDQLITEYRMKHRDGTWRWLSSHETIYLRNADGKPKQIFGMIHDITQQKLAEEAIRVSEENFLFQFQNMNAYNSLYEVVTDKEGIPYDFRFIMVNPAYEDYVGKKASELIGKTLLEVYPDTEQFWIDKMTEAVVTKLPVHFENFSKVMNTHTEISLFVPKVGQLAMTTGNIAQRKRAEEALRENENQLRIQNAQLIAAIKKAEQKEQELRKTQKITHVGSWYLDLTTQEVSWTEELYRMYGFDPSLPVPPYTEHQKLFTPQSWNILSSSLANTRKTGTPYELELEMVRKDGSRGWVWVRGETVLDGEKNTIGLWGAAQDITERKQIEKELRESKAATERFLNVAAEIIISLDAHGTITLLNDSGHTLLGYKNGELIGRNWFDTCLPKEIVSDIKVVFSKLMNEDIKNVTHYENTVVTKTGAVKSIFWHNSLLRDTNGKPIGLLSSGEDITERKMMEEELLKSQKLESLGVLAGGIAHDFNNLMGGIFGYIEMAKEQSTEPQVTQRLLKAMTAIERAKGLTTQLLTFAKGGAPIQKIGNLFPFVEETAKFSLSGSNVSCHFAVQPNLWSCNFDKNQIGQVIENMIINAQQAMPVGGTIELSAHNIQIAENEHHSLPQGKYVTITVKDCGTGIQKELISKIFDPFFSTKTKGHGLGLATCYSIINRHGGCIDVASEPGKGTTFIVYLPASTESVLTLSENKTVAFKDSGTILVMDDEEVMRETTQDMLELMGYSVVCKENGRDAIDFFTAAVSASRPISGMIFDLTVPGGMGGKDAVLEIRKLNTEVPIFVASGYADDPIMKNPVDYGFTASICKPFRRSELSEMLNRYLKTNQ